MSTIAKIAQALAYRIQLPQHVRELEARVRQLEEQTSHMGEELEQQQASWVAEKTTMLSEQSVLCQKMQAHDRGPLQRRNSSIKPPYRPT